MKELDVLALKEDLPALGLEAWDLGTIVMAYGKEEAFEFEFVTPYGDTWAAETLNAEQLRKFCPMEVPTKKL